MHRKQLRMDQKNAQLKDTLIKSREKQSKISLAIHKICVFHRKVMKMSLLKITIPYLKQKKDRIQEVVNKAKDETQKSNYNNTVMEYLTVLSTFIQGNLEIEVKVLMLKILLTNHKVDEARLLMDQLLLKTTQQGEERRKQIEYLNIQLLSMEEKSGDAVTCLTELGERSNREQFLESSFPILKKIGKLEQAQLQINSLLHFFSFKTVAPQKMLKVYVELSQVQKCMHNYDKEYFTLICCQKMFHSQSHDRKMVKLEVLICQRLLQNLVVRKKYGQALNQALILVERARLAFGKQSKQFIKIQQKYNETNELFTKPQAAGINQKPFHEKYSFHGQLRRTVKNQNF